MTSGPGPLKEKAFSHGESMSKVITRDVENDGVDVVDWVRSSEEV